MDLPVKLPLDDIPTYVMFLAAVVVLFTEVLKKTFKVKNEKAAAIAIVLGITLSLLTQLATDYPSMQPYYEKALWGFIIGLVAAGGFSVYKAFMKPS